MARVTRTRTVEAPVVNAAVSELTESCHGTVSAPSHSTSLLPYPYDGPLLCDCWPFA